MTNFIQVGLIFVFAFFTFQQFKLYITILNIYIEDFYIILRQQAIINTYISRNFKIQLNIDILLKQLWKITSLIKLKITQYLRKWS